MPLDAKASAPGKVILFGEHAVVYGEPSLSLAVDQRTSVSGAAVGDQVTVNGRALNPRWHRYILQAVERHWDGPLRLQVESGVPSSSGMGSSAALSVATCAVLLRLRSEGPVEPARIAEASFDAERDAQGGASPNDTTVSTAGGGVLLAPVAHADLDVLWRIERDELAWVAHRVDVPALPLVVAFTGRKGNTARMVAKVRRFVERNAFGRDVIAEIGGLVAGAVDALADGDLAEVGRLMDRNHVLLHTLGVATPELTRLVEVAGKAAGTYGAKLTGAGGGGSIVVLTEEPAEAAKALSDAGAETFEVHASPRGVTVEADGRPDP